MAKDVEMIAVAESMSLHDERLRLANDRVRQLRADLEKAVIHQDAVRDARISFMRYVRPNQEG